jgi:hypothetical protein
MAVYQGISDYNSQVLQNGVSVPFSSWEVSHDSDNLTGNWSVQFPEPREITLGSIDDVGVDLFSIVRTVFGVEEYLVRDQPGRGGQQTEAWQKYTRGVSGLIQSEFDPKASPEKDLYFFNPTWLNDVTARAWTIQDGMIHWSKGAGGQQSSYGARIIGNGFPPAEKAEGTFTCFASQRTHRAVAYYLAQQMNCTLFCNVPDLTIQRVLHIPSTQSYWQSIQNLFSVFNPHYQVGVDPDGSTPRLEILDVFVDAGNQQTTQSMELELKAILEKSYSEDSPDKTKIANHVIIKGAKAINISLNSNSLGGAITSKTLTPIELSEDHSIQFTEGIQDLNDKKSMGTFNGQIGKAGNQKDLEWPKKGIKERYYHEDPHDPSNWILVRDVLTTISNLGNTLSRKETKHKFARSGNSYKPCYSVDEISMNYQVPGEKRKQWDVVYRKVTDQTYQDASLKMSHTKTLVEQKVLMEKQVTPSTGQTYYLDPITLMEAIQSNRIQDYAGTNQIIEETTTNIGFNHTSRETDGSLIQEEFEYDILGGSIRFDAQAMKDPNDGKQSKKETQFQKEFYYGTEPWYPAVEREDPDIATETEAQAVADRVYAWSKMRKQEISLTLATIIPLATTTMPCKLPDLALLRLNGTVFEPFTLTGDTYTITNLTEKCTIEKGGNPKPSQTMKLRNSL